MGSAPPTLTDMPLDVLKVVFGYAGCLGIQCLRKVCHDFRNYIDDVTPETSDIKEVTIGAFEHYVSLHLATKTERHTIFYDLEHVTGYRPREFFEIYMWEERLQNCENGKFEENKIFLKNFKQDVELIFKFISSKTSVLEKLQLMGHMYPSQLSDETLAYVSEHFNSLLSIRTLKLKVKHLELYDITHEYSKSILTSLEPGTLKKIIISAPRCRLEEESSDVWMDITEIGKLEQWKQAGCLKMMAPSVVGPASAFSHFSNVKLTLGTMSIELLVELKNALKTCTQIEKFEISYSRFTGLGRLPALLGDAVFNDDDDYLKTAWYIRTPDPSRVLKINYFFDAALLRFSLQNMNVVPIGVLIQE